ncbi:MAG: hypothetical protein KZQ66_10295, partial [Candidatus Thiodiazotropha sp. (ex Lucinoma aequizonata)]|nr:hypothetical protein [Candidatus Thiodiazotropha sp. (ex Lucinoma aequizonata)]MCU7899151.1 hypothetical protein [Candidatus Thiodiazotropha sp. (ex Lucinoma aequizonata)]MCU7902328.1 hypothetical protein [Candidatus Thiodiazotropha sp. (ex Lucinoma aequizonata)]MCU7909141.1 hypothetical protein [Candidatus Thiodiazotropha sp. (ex Lucinoma aequizonata)]
HGPRPGSESSCRSYKSPWVTIMNRNSLLSESFHVGIKSFVQTHFILDKAGGEFWSDGYFASTVGKHGDEAMIGK